MIVEIVLVAGAIGAVVVMGRFWSASLKRRRLRFARRPLRPFVEWYEEFYGGRNLSREIVKEVHEWIAASIGVDISQIYPTDRFDRELKCPEWWVPRGEELDEAELRMVRYFKQCEKERGIKILPHEFAAETVFEFVEEVNGLVASDPQ